VANERLRSCITSARLTIPDVAAQVGVDPKTVERGSSSGEFPTDRTDGQLPRCLGPTRPTSGPRSPTTGERTRPVPPSW